jgi:hypothetical protein
MRYFIPAAAFVIMICAGFFYALSSTLTEMTQQDCRSGIAAACRQLQQAGVQP